MRVENSQSTYLYLLFRLVRNAFPDFSETEILNTVLDMAYGLPEMEFDEPEPEFN